MLKRLVGDWMTRRVLGVAPEDPVFAALEVMAEHGVRHVLVIDSRGVQGIVSNRDVVRAPRSAEPAHAVRKARRRQAHLRVLEALADFAQHVARGYAQ